MAVPIEQKTSGGKKKKAPAEIILMLGQRKGKKQVTIVYGLDLFGIKLKDAAKAAKRKFATGSSITVVCIFATFLLLFADYFLIVKTNMVIFSSMFLLHFDGLKSADNREVIEIQGSRQEDMAELVHKEWGVPKESIFIVNAQKKKVKAFP